MYSVIIHIIYMLCVDLYRIVISKCQILYILNLLFILYKYTRSSVHDVISHYNVVHDAIILQQY
eukprot:UN05173